ncbi:MAG: methyltransferase type 11 [Bacteroidetes bacterium 4572_112]|nr:MAG: methyltransferase type 11 [Bacteroidetes bacterium 4572_112]
MDLLEHKLNSADVRHPWETARLEVIQRLLQKDSKLLQAKHIADIGCGDTFVVNSLANKFPQKLYTAIDSAFTDDDIKIFSSQSDNNILLKKNVDDIIDTKAIDIVLLMDVIEHIEFEVDFLKTLAQNKAITKETTFLITVPAFNSLFSAHDTYLKHYRRYNNNELQKVAKQAGLDIKSSGYFFSTLLIIRVLEKIKEILIGKKEQKGLNEKQYNKKTAGIIKTFLLLDFGITNLFNKIGIKIPGLSTYIICTKSAQ